MLLSDRMQRSRKECGMPHIVLSEIAAAIDIQTGAVVSRVIFRDDRTDVTVFGFDAGEGSPRTRLRDQPSCRLSRVGWNSSRTVSNSIQRTRDRRRVVNATGASDGIGATPVAALIALGALVAGCGHRSSRLLLEIAR